MATPIDFPSNPAVGSKFAASTGVVYQWTGVAWVLSYDVARVPTITVAADPPTVPAPQIGDQWWNTINGQLFVWYDDGTSAQWVVANRGLVATTTEVGKVRAQTAWLKSFVTLTGGSQILLPPNVDRVGFIVWNRVGNAQIAVDVSGSALTSLAEGRMLGAGNDYYFTGVHCSPNQITILGTAGQIVNLWEGI